MKRRVKKDFAPKQKFGSEEKRTRSQTGVWEREAREAVQDPAIANAKKRFRVKVIQLGVATAILILLILTSGCLNPFAPKLTDTLETGDMIITSQKAPQEVLQNFKIAYTFRDSLLYSDVLDTAFLFVYFDPNEGTSGRIVSWGREVDLLTTGRLFRHFQVIDLVWNETIYENAGEKESEISRGFNLTLSGENASFSIAGRAVFSFKLCKDEKWRITRWKDESDL